MKKLFLGALMMAGFASFSFAQTAMPAAKATAPKPAAVTMAKPAAATMAKPATATMAKPAVKPATATAAKPAVAAPAKTAATGVVLKKDGTPDKRFKNATPAVPVKPTKKVSLIKRRFDNTRNAAACSVFFILETLSFLILC